MICSAGIPFYLYPVDRLLQSGLGKSGFAEEVEAGFGDGALHFDGRNGSVDGYIACGKIYFYRNGSGKGAYGFFNSCFAVGARHPFYFINGLHGCIIVLCLVDVLFAFAAAAHKCVGKECEQKHRAGGGEPVEVQMAVGHGCGGAGRDEP